MRSHVTKIVVLLWVIRCVAHPRGDIKCVWIMGGVMFSRNFVGKTLPIASLTTCPTWATLGLNSSP